jgi:mannose-6-phosphate isomerase-like protein (cupin superfamily)
VRILEIMSGPDHPIERYGSVGAHHLGGVRFDGGGGWTLLSLGTDSKLGRHPTVLPQLFVVLEGSGWVTGGNGVRTAIQAGQAALWEAGEEHESGSGGGMKVAVLEAGSIDIR